MLVKGDGRSNGPQIGRSSSRSKGCSRRWCIAVKTSFASNGSGRTKYDRPESQTLVRLRPCWPADLREAIAAARATTGTLPTGSQIDALRESIAMARASGNSHTPTRRPVNRINKSSLKPDPTLEQPKGEAAPQMPAAQATPPRLQRSPTGTYRKVNRRPPDSPNEVSDA